ncbi:Glutamate-rich WD repeat-containing protein 1 [Trichinella patagoniensis]|uniref:Glutamate-rich WD repeat-containing protein 1 n=1 Tax=Trichinella patagoniensis TaxID=990121 RepID=A0A0V1A258_9BILA|nr:Glutamate-rich WD repeat-containing protein 1 [Trichinella patagoniensis]
MCTCYIDRQKAASANINILCCEIDEIEVHDSDTSDLSDCVEIGEIVEADSVSEEEDESESDCTSDDDDEVKSHDDEALDDTNSSTVASKEITKKIYIPGQSRPLKEGEELVCDKTAYVMLSSFYTDYPCLSFDPLPVKAPGSDTKCSFPMDVMLVSGTQASHPMRNRIHVMMLGNLLELKDDDDDSHSSDGEEKSRKKRKNKDTKIFKDITIDHRGDVNRIRACRIETTTLCATWSSLKKVHVWNLSAAVKAAETVFGKKSRDKLDEKPVFTFHGHMDEGFALDWCRHVPGQLLTGDCKGNIHFWKMVQGGEWQIDQRPFKQHQSSVEDLQWSHQEANVFFSCSADRSILVWDCRMAPKDACVFGIPEAHRKDVNVISVHRTEPWLVSGGDDGLLKGFGPVVLLPFHKGPITSVSWCPHERSVFCASAEDDVVSIWDLVGNREENADICDMKILSRIPQQLIFLHMGQIDIKEVNWHPDHEGVLISTASDAFNIFKTISCRLDGVGLLVQAENRVLESAETRASWIVSLSFIFTDTSTKSADCLEQAQIAEKSERNFVLGHGSLGIRRQFRGHTGREVRRTAAGRRRVEHRLQVPAPSGRLVLLGGGRGRIGFVGWVPDAQVQLGQGPFPSRRSVDGVLPLVEQRPLAGVGSERSGFGIVADQLGQQFPAHHGQLVEASADQVGTPERLQHGGRDRYVLTTSLLELLVLDQQGQADAQHRRHQTEQVDRQPAHHAGEHFAEPAVRRIVAVSDRRVHDYGQVEGRREIGIVVFEQLVPVVGTLPPGEYGGDAEQRQRAEKSGGYQFDPVQQKQPLQQVPRVTAAVEVQKAQQVDEDQILQLLSATTPLVVPRIQHVAEQQCGRQYGQVDQRIDAGHVAQLASPASESVVNADNPKAEQNFAQEVDGQREFDGEQAQLEHVVIDPGLGRLDQQIDHQRGDHHHADGQVDDDVRHVFRTFETLVQDPPDVLHSELVLQQHQQFFFLSRSVYTKPTVVINYASTLVLGACCSFLPKMIEHIHYPSTGKVERGGTDEVFDK